MSQILGSKAIPSTEEQRPACAIAQRARVSMLRGSLAKVPPDEIRSGSSMVFFNGKEDRVVFNKKFH